ncbi:ATP-binding cassette domain-containing protein [Actinoalloteichus hymeniacidonis]|uniref:ABC transporter n=1 Tax=Actinoalloteichus hymeniacidonis TaxID=340345 RepID=A0AAC9HKL6_9PSEU|nr:dipeptide/oligopeptide/nickel ABC transporter ATP-binding protein [Actinoalloteichus hymeniacidonis]AOS61028.1 ABC transporter [Actinoalloteichus hymeniacidonis]MBB5910972.1 peptide/nickel transport system ATP-binding protein [Actinoalloteichus hymeniacidonis]
MSEQPILQVQDLVVEFPGAGGTPFRAVSEVGFELHRGRTVGIVGESGCGKSTIARSIVRLQRPTSGRIVLDGTDITRLSERKLRPMRARIQMIFQDPYASLDPHLDAGDIVGEPLKLQGMKDSAQRRKAATDLLARVELPESAVDKRPDEFSGGQRQRIGIARALACKPDVLVCDEATSALDVSVQAQVIALLKDIQAESGVAFVVIAHNLGVVRELSDEVLVMRKGEVVEHGPAAQVLGDPAAEYTRQLRSAALDPTTITGRKPRYLLAAIGAGGIEEERTS